MQKNILPTDDSSARFREVIILGLENTEQSLLEISANLSRLTDESNLTLKEFTKVKPGYYYKTITDDRKVTETVVLIEPNNNLLKEQLCKVCNFLFIYYGGHASGDGDWSYTDIDGVRCRFTFDEFHSALENKSGEVILNCCYSSKWKDRLLKEKKIGTGGAGAINQLESSNEGRKSLTSDQIASSNFYHYASFRFWTQQENEVSIGTKSNPMLQHFMKFAGECYETYADDVRAASKLKHLQCEELVDECAFYSFPDKGSADCFVVICGMKTCVLVDSLHGSGFENVWNELIGKVENINLAICTHSDSDHVGGFVRMQNSGFLDRINTFWLNPAEKPITLTNPPVDATRSKASAQKLLQSHAYMKISIPPLVLANEDKESLKNTYFKDNAITSCYNHTSCKDSELTVDVILPKVGYFCDNYSITDAKIINKISIVSVLTWKNKDKTYYILFPGDADCWDVVSAVENSAFKDITFDIVIIPHHGSDPSNYDEKKKEFSFTKLKTKRFIVTGKSDKYNHPGENFTENLSKHLNDGTDLEVYFNFEDVAEKFRKKFDENQEPLLDRIKHAEEVGTHDSTYKFIKIDLTQTNEAPQTKSTSTSINKKK